MFSGGSPEDLKAAYLYCDRLATTELFDSSAAASSSMAYEALKARAFGGDFQRLLAWWKTQQHSAKSNAAAALKPISAQAAIEDGFAASNRANGRTATGRKRRLSVGSVRARSTFPSMRTACQAFDCLGGARWRYRLRTHRDPRSGIVGSSSPCSNNLLSVQDTAVRHPMLHARQTRVCDAHLLTRPSLSDGPHAQTRERYGRVDLGS
jgi:hypothetical protein